MVFEVFGKEYYIYGDNVINELEANDIYLKLS
jgi:hypothetical protein